MLTRFCSDLIRLFDDLSGCYTVAMNLASLARCRVNQLLQVEATVFKGSCMCSVLSSTTRTLGLLCIRRHTRFKFQAPVFSEVTKLSVCVCVCVCARARMFEYANILNRVYLQLKRMNLCSIII